MDILRQIIHHLITESFLLEGRLENVQKKYEHLGKWGKRQVKLLSQRDPSGNNKYLDWMAKQLLAAYDPPPIEYIVKAIEFFHKNIQRFPKKDINQYRSLDILEKTIEEIESKQTQKQMRGQAKAGMDTVFKADDLLVLHPKNKAAACHYGKGTKWCISATNSENYFQSYSDKGIVFYFVFTNIKDSDYHKIALAYDEYDNLVEIYDAANNLVPQSEFSDFMRSFYGDEQVYKMFAAIHRHLETIEKPKSLYDAADDLFNECNKGLKHVNITVDEPRYDYPNVSADAKVYIDFQSWNWFSQKLYDMVVNNAVENGEEKANIIEPHDHLAFLMGSSKYEILEDVKKAVANGPIKDLNPKTATSGGGSHGSHFVLIFPVGGFDLDDPYELKDLEQAKAFCEKMRFVENNIEKVIEDIKATLKNDKWLK